MPTLNENNSTTLMKMVEAVAINPENARILVAQYEAQAKKLQPKASDSAIQKIVTDKVIERYCRLAATSGAVTALPGVIPGAGTALALVGGGMVDVTACMKLQIDMTMCLAMSINKNLSNEDAKHMSFIIALVGSLEKMGVAGASNVASKAGVKMVKHYLSGTTLKFIKKLFEKVGIAFTQKAAIKAIPLGFGAIIAGTANYALTQYVGSTARKMFLLNIEEKGVAA